MVRISCFPSKLMLKLMLLLAAVLSLQTAEAKLACETTEECETKLRVGSECIDGSCSNPFVEGCIKTMLESKTEEELAAMELNDVILDAQERGRICNSDDKKDGTEDRCSPQEFDYFEIRLHNSNWESSIFLTWIMQIMLMEVMQVPVTIGLNSRVTNATSFYSPVNSLEYSSVTYPWEALRISNTKDESGTYVPCNAVEEDCIDVMPEVWNGQVKEWTDALATGHIDALDWGGQVGKLAWYIPEATASRDPTLVSYYGLRGEENRAKLAETFKRPTTWVEYCEEVSIDNCTTPDIFATEYPDTDSAAKYFADGKYTGYFRLLPENNCTNFPETCTGYMVGPPCSWSTNVDAQLYWNDIVGLKSDGTEVPNRGYSYGSMIEIWKAANATSSDTLMWWWQPEAMLDKFKGSGWGFQHITLPTVTDVCFKNRVSGTDRCDEDPAVRRGDPLGACDDEAHALLKIMSSNLPERTLLEKNQAKRSPGYPFIRSLKINDLEMQHILNTWTDTGVDTYGNDAREAVCSWVVDNIEQLLEFIPMSHPRKKDQQGSFKTGFVYFALAFAAVALLCLIAVAGLVHKFRQRKVFVYAQVIFVNIILFGFMLIIIGGALYAIEPNDGACISRSWLTNIGFSTVLSAVLVKMSTINRIMQKSKRCKRVKVSRKAMFGSLGVLVMFDVIILVVWTAMDPPSAVEQMQLPDETEPLVVVSQECSTNKIFQYILEVWHFLLLLVASVLAFQSRDIVPAFNESRSIGTMVYSNFLFLIIRLIVLVLGEQDLIAPNIYGASLSVLLVLDTIVATVIYIVPKIMQANSDPFDHVSRDSLQINSVSRFSSGGINAGQISVVSCASLELGLNGAAKEVPVFGPSSKKSLKTDATAKDVTFSDNNNSFSSHSKRSSGNSGDNTPPVVDEKDEGKDDEIMSAGEPS